MYLALEEGLKRCCFFLVIKDIFEIEKKIMVILCLFVLPVRWHIHLRHFLKLGTARGWTLEPGARVLSVLGLITCLTAQPPLTKTPCYKCYILFHVWLLEPNVSCGVRRQSLTTTWFHLSRKWEMHLMIVFASFPCTMTEMRCFHPSRVSEPWNHVNVILSVSAMICIEGKFR